MDTLLQDVRFAVRTLLKQPAFTLIAVLSLALGIGANAAVFSFVDAFVLRPMPYAEPDELLHVWGQTRRGLSRVSVPNFIDWREQSSSFTDLAAFNYTIETITGGEVPEQISGGRISANAFSLLGVAPLVGRDFAAGEDSVAAAPVALLSERFWTDRYSRDPEVIGRTLEVDEIEYTIVGVMPQGVNFPLPTTEAWFPRFLDAPEATRNRGMLQIVGRLAPGATPEAAQQEMTGIAERLAQTYPDANEDLGVRLVPLREALNFAWEIIQPMSLVLLASVGFVLLIGCANVASLMLARATTREREIAVRAALGAGRRRLVRQLLTESAVIAVAGGLIGLVVARFALRGLDSTIPGDLYRVGQLQLDGPVLGFALLLSLATALIFGAVPALRASRTELVDSLKEGTGGSGTGRRKLGLQSAMVAVEMTLAIVLLVGTSLMVRTLGNLQAVDTGFTSEGVISARMLLERNRYSDAETIAAFHSELADRVRALPGVSEAATVDYLPLNHESSGAEFEIVGEPEPESPRGAVVFSVSPGYFDVMGIGLKGGRVLADSDEIGGQRVAVIDETLAQRYFGDEDPVGRQIRFAGADFDTLVVGVVGAVRQVDLAGALEPVIYLSQQQSPRRYMRVLARTEGDPTQLAGALRETVAAIDPRLPLSEVRTLSRVVEDFLLPQQMLVDALGFLAAGALLLAAIGVYGLMAFFVSQRVRDIGIHVALGATRGRVRWMIADRVLRLAAIGVGVGLLVSFGVMQLLGSFLYGVDSADPLAFLGSALFLTVVALLAGVLGARRATRVDPMSALRAE